MGEESGRSIAVTAGISPIWISTGIGSISSWGDCLRGHRPGR